MVSVPVIYVRLPNPSTNLKLDVVPHPPNTPNDISWSFVVPDTATRNK